MQLGYSLQQPDIWWVPPRGRWPGAAEEGPLPRVEENRAPGVDQTAHARMSTNRCR
jgi:hypothetical protein